MENGVNLDSEVIQPPIIGLDVASEDYGKYKKILRELNKNNVAFSHVIIDSLLNPECGADKVKGVKLEDRAAFIVIVVRNKDVSIKGKNKDATLCLSD